MKTGIEDIESLLHDKTTSDVTIIVGKRRFSAHKCILAARSDVFKKMFFSDMKERTQNEITIEESSEEAFDVLLHYCYTYRYDNTFNKCLDRVFDVYIIADRFLMQGLIDLWIDNIISIIDCKNVARIRDFAICHAIDKLIARVKAYMKSNALKIMSSEK